MAGSQAGLTGQEAEKHAAEASAVLSSVGHVVLGQERAIEEAFSAFLARGHVLLEGVPGTAKTLMVRTLGEVMGLSFRRVQFTPDLMPSDVTGVNVLGAGGEFTFRPGPIFGDLLLADEINRAPAKTQAALLEAMQERRATVDGVSHPLPEAFTVFATQNPIEFEGTYPLPEAELDRFLVKVLLGYPSAATETGLLARVVEGFEADEPASYGVSRVLDRDGVTALRAAVRRVRVEPALLEYITTLVRATRDTPALTLGASPRASVGLLKMAQAAALLAGRGFVIPDDVKSAAPAVLRHRVMVAPELELEGVTADAALASAIERIEAPRT